MTLHGELVDSVKWILCDFYKAEPPLGDSNVEYDFAEKIVASVREQIAQEIEDKCDLDNIENCLLVNHDLCNFHVSANIARGK